MIMTVMNVLLSLSLRHFPNLTKELISIQSSRNRNITDLIFYYTCYLKVLFEGMVNQIYPSELQLNKANTSDTEAPFLDLHLSISNGFVSSKIYDRL